MHKRDNQPEDFNPEKFLAADLKKETPAGYESTVHLGAHESTVDLGLSPIVLEPHFKKTLLDRLDAEHPNIFDPEARHEKGETRHEKIVERGAVMRTFLRRALAQRHLRVGGNTFQHLFMDLLLGMAERCLKKKRGEAKPDLPPKE